MLTVRAATFDDAIDILDWRNDPGARAMSRDSNVIDVAAHLRWFESSLARADRQFFIGEHEGQKIGMMRFDRHEDGNWEVSHNMAPASRGKGLGQKMIAAVLGQFDPRPIVAEIRQDNPSCWHIYEKAGFKLTEADEVNRHYILERA